MIIAVIDGMGGSIGHQIVKLLRQSLPEDTDIMALGTNAAATGNMMKARATRGATGENAIAISVLKADLIMGSLSIVIPNSMMGEITPSTATAVASAPGRKMLLPLTNPPLEIIGVTHKPLQKLIREAIAEINSEEDLSTEE